MYPTTSDSRPTDLATLTLKTSDNTEECVEMSLDLNDMADLTVAEASDMILDEASGSEQNE